LNKLEKEGETLDNDEVPVVYIRAENEKEAKERVLEYNTKYSEINLNYIIEERIPDLDLDYIDLYT
tara:strand:- start:181 stop:378 length:198 start_codon:yes stop_codon:yes gene_type:complete